MLFDVSTGYLTKVEFVLQMTPHISAARMLEFVSNL